MVYEIDTDIKNASRKAHKVLYGSKVVGARYLSKKEAKEIGWYKVGLILWLETEEGNTIQMIVQQDDEGNDSGVIAYQVWENYLDRKSTNKKRKMIKSDLFYNIHI